MAQKELLYGIGNDLVNALVEKLDHNGSVDTGFLKNNIDVIIKGNTIILEMPSYGKYVEFGTAPHIIRPKDKKALKWGKGKNAKFAKVVRHPGSRPKPFIRPTIHQQLGQIIKKNIQRHVK